MSEDLKTRLTDAMIADLNANLPLADIIGEHSDHRLKDVPDEVLLVYDLAPSLTATEVWAAATRTLTAFQFSLYSYGPTSLADAAYYVPAANTIVFLAALTIAAVGAKDDFYWFDGETSKTLDDAFVLVGCDDKNALFHPKVCDGTYLKVRNMTGGARDLKMLGLTMA